MINGALQDTIRGAIETGELSSLHDHFFSDDVQRGMRMAVEPLASEERFIPSVIDRLQDPGNLALPPSHAAPEVVANGERVVAFRDETVSLRSGVAIRVPCTLVIDVRDGMITRLAIAPCRAPVEIHRRESHAKRTEGRPRTGVQ